MSDKQLTENVGICPFCKKNDNYVEAMDFSSCAVLCRCGAQGPGSLPENENDLRIEEEQDLYSGHVAAVRRWQAAQQEAEPVGEVQPIIRPDWLNQENTKGVAFVDKELLPGTKLYTQPKVVPSYFDDFERIPATVNNGTWTPAAAYALGWNNCRAAMLASSPPKAVPQVSGNMRAENEALRDMLEDSRLQIDLIREALGIPSEPHQGMAERILAAVEALKAKQSQVEMLDSLRVNKPIEQAHWLDEVAASAERTRIRYEQREKEVAKAAWPIGEVSMDDYLAAQDKLNRQARQMLDLMKTKPVDSEGGHHD